MFKVPIISYKYLLVALKVNSSLLNLTGGVARKILFNRVEDH